MEAKETPYQKWQRERVAARAASAGGPTSGLSAPVPPSPATSGGAAGIHLPYTGATGLGQLSAPSFSRPLPPPPSASSAGQGTPAPPPQATVPRPPPPSSLLPPVPTAAPQFLPPPHSAGAVAFSERGPGRPTSAPQPLPALPAAPVAPPVGSAVAVGDADAKARELRERMERNRAAALAKLAQRQQPPPQLQHQQPGQLQHNQSSQSQHQQAQHLSPAAAASVASTSAGAGPAMTVAPVFLRQPPSGTASAAAPGPTGTAVPGVLRGRRPLTVDLELFSADRFAVVPPSSMQNSRAFEYLMKGLPGCKMLARMWTFPMAAVDATVERLRNHQEWEVTVNPIPEFSLSALSLTPAAAATPAGKRRSKQFRHLNFSQDEIRSIADLPPDLHRRLMQFQREGVEFGLRHHGRCLIGDEMGLGKTIQAIAIAWLFRTEWPLLVVCPSSMRMTWADELKNWLPDLAPADITVVFKQNQIRGRGSDGARVLIISYDLLSRCAADFADRHYDFIIADESHYLKSAKSNRTKVLLPLLKGAKRAVLLTGTPALSRPAELHPQIAALRPDLFSDWRAFAHRFCAPKPARFGGGTDYSGASHTRELHTLLESAVMIRRLKNDVLTQLPKKRRQRVQVDVDAAAVKEIAKLLSSGGGGDFDAPEAVETLADLTSDAPSGGGSGGAGGTSARQVVNKAFVLTGRAKIDGTCQYVEDLICGGCKFLIFAHHVEVLDAIEHQVNKLKTQYIRIDGRTPQLQRKPLVDRFQAEEMCQVAILAITAAGQGLTLTAASTVVFAEMHWVPGLMHQAEDRAHRIGQHRSVNVHYLFGEGTLDARIWPTLQRKLEVVSATLNGEKEQLTAEKVEGIGAFHVEEGSAGAAGDTGAAGDGAPAEGRDGEDAFAFGYTPTGPGGKRKETAPRMPSPSNFFTPRKKAKPATATASPTVAPASGGSGGFASQQKASYEDVFADFPEDLLLAAAENIPSAAFTAPSFITRGPSAPLQPALPPPPALSALPMPPELPDSFVNGGLKRLSTGGMKLSPAASTGAGDTEVDAPVVSGKRRRFPRSILDDEDTC